MCAAYICKQSVKLGHVSKNIWTMFCSQIAARNIWNISFRTCLSPKKNETSLRGIFARNMS